MSKDFHFETDAGETIVVSRNALNYVEKEVQQRRRMTKFRQILRVETVAPFWAEQFSYDKVTTSAEWAPMRDYTEDLAMATVKTENVSFPIYEMGSGYSYREREMIRAQQMGMNLDTTKAKSCYDKADSVLESIAADGTWNGSKSLGNLKGIVNQDGVEVAGANVGFNTTSLQDSIVKEGNSDARDAAIEQAIEDFLYLENRLIILTKETMPGDTLLVPLSERAAFRTSKSRKEKPMEQELIDRSSYIRRVIYWNMPDARDYGADGTHKRRYCLLNASDADAARFVLPMAPRPGRAVQMPGRVVVPMGMVVGGFNTKALESMIYADVADNA